MYWRVYYAAHPWKAINLAREAAGSERAIALGRLDRAVGALSSSQACVDTLLLPEPNLGIGLRGTSASRPRHGPLRCPRRPSPQRALERTARSAAHRREARRSCSGTQPASRCAGRAVREPRLIPLERIEHLGESVLRGRSTVLGSNRFRATTSSSCQVREVGGRH